WCEDAGARNRLSGRVNSRGNVTRAPVRLAQPAHRLGTQNAGVRRPAGRLDDPRTRGPLHALDEPRHPGVLGGKRVLAQHGPLRLVVELEVDPVDGEVAAVRLRRADEVAAQLGPGRLRWADLGVEGLDVGAHARGQAT